MNTDLIDRALVAGIEGKCVLYACQSWEKAREVLGVFDELRGDFPEIVKVTHSYSNTGVWFGSGGHIRLMSATPHAGRGFIADLLCLDGVVDERALASLMPCVAGGGEIASVEYV